MHKRSPCAPSLTLRSYMKEQNRWSNEKHMSVGKEEEEGQCSVEGAAKDNDPSVCKLPAVSRGEVFRGDSYPLCTICSVLFTFLIYPL